MYRDSMRALLLVLIAACSFNPSKSAPATPTQDGDIVATQDDAPAETHDDVMPTPHDAQRDARPDACVDSDDDGVCDSVEWPCGALPPPLASSIEVDHNGSELKVVVSNIDVDDSGQRVVGTPGQTVALKLHYTVNDTCATCADQIEWGWGAGHRVDCLYDATPGNNGANGNAGTNPTITFQLPATTGAYDLRINDGQNYGCNDSRGAAQVTNEGWWQANPGAANTIAKVCVH